MINGLSKSDQISYRAILLLYVINLVAFFPYIETHLVFFSQIYKKILLQQIIYFVLPCFILTHPKLILKVVGIFSIEILPSIEILNTGMYGLMLLQVAINGTDQIQLKFLRVTQ